MKKYQVCRSVEVYQYFEVEAENEEQAREKFEENVCELSPIEEEIHEEFFTEIEEINE